MGAFIIGRQHRSSASDHVTLRHLVHSVFWNIIGNQPFPQPVDTWELNNGTALVVRPMNSLEVSDFFVFERFSGMLLTDSSDASQNPTCGYGRGSDYRYRGSAIRPSHHRVPKTPGYKFTNVYRSRQGDIGVAAVQVSAGDSLPPKLRSTESPRVNLKLGLTTRFPLPQ